MALQNPLIYKDNAHKPIDPAVDAINPAAIALSTAPNNQLRAGADGLYVGTSYISSIVYVAAAGVDDLLHGTKAAPFKTLDFAFAQVLNFNLTNPGAVSVIALKAGETFTITGRHFIPVLSSLTLTFYGDATYGDFNSPLVNGTVLPAMMANLNRPIITQTVLQTNGYYISNGFTNGTLRLEGVQVNLAATPAGPPPNSSYGAMDFFYVSGGASTSMLDLVGTVINRADANSVGGIYGVGGRNRAALRQLASQFRIAGVPANASAGLTAAQLASRVHFLHMYLDYPGSDVRDYSNPVFPSSATSSNGTGLTELTWSDTTTATLPQGATLPSFPTLADPQFGFRNYITGLTRDQQQRPLNFISGRLF